MTGESATENAARLMNPRILSDASTSVYLGGHSLREYPSIAGYLENFCGGREACPESDFYGNLGLGRAGVLETTLAHVRKWSDIPELREYELSRTAKYGGQGFIYPLASDLQIENILDYYRYCNRPCKVTPNAMKAWFKAMEGPLLVPYTPEQVIQRQLEKTGLTSNCGLMHTTAFRRRKDVIELGIAESLDIRSASDVTKYVSVVGGRSTKQKERLIFMQPMPINIAELQYVYALMDAMLLRVPWVAAWKGQPSVEEAVNKYMWKDAATYVSTDYTKMDTRVGMDQHRVYLSAVLPLFEPKYRERYRQIVLAKPRVPVVVGVTKTPGVAQGAKKSYHLVTLNGLHGKTSGEGDTNCEETVLSCLNHLMQDEFGLTTIGFQVNGDDGAHSYDSPKVDPAEVFSKTSAMMGFDANPSKQLVSDHELRYLQRVYSEETQTSDGVLGSYPMVLMVNSLKNPERYADLSRPQRAIRALEIAENCFHHPKAPEIFHYVVEGYPQLQEWRGQGHAFWKSLEDEHAKLVNAQDRASHGHSNSGLAGYSIVNMLQAGKI
jgi:hypothetical protein